MLRHVSDILYLKAFFSRASLMLRGRDANISFVIFCIPVSKKTYLSHTLYCFDSGRTNKNVFFSEKMKHEVHLVSSPCG